MNGLKWVRYVGPNSSTLEAPKDDPVLISYARLLNQGYVRELWSTSCPVPQFHFLGIDHENENENDEWE